MKPLVLQIGLAKWKVRFRKNQMMHDGEPCDGLCIYDTKTILVYENLENPDLTIAAFWHEWVHACFFELGSDLCDNESFVESFSQNIARTARAIPPEFK